MHFGDRRLEVMPIATPLRIDAARRGETWYALSANEPAVWGCGSSQDAAIGNLVRAHAERFNVVIEPSHESEEVS